MCHARDQEQPGPILGSAAVARVQARTRAGDQVILSTRGGMAIRFDESDVRSMGRPAYGVKGIALLEGDEVVGMVVANGPTSRKVRPGLRILRLTFARLLERDHYHR